MQEKIGKLQLANRDLAVKIDANKANIRELVGKIAGVKAGDVVVFSGARYRVTKIVSDSVPAKGLPILEGVKIAKNGNEAKRAVEIKGKWAVEGNAAAAPAKRGRKPKAASASVSGLALPKKRRGRPSKAELAAAAIEGTA